MPVGTVCITALALIVSNHVPASFIQHVAAILVVASIVRNIAALRVRVQMAEQFPCIRSRKFVLDLVADIIPFGFASNFATHVEVADELPVFIFLAGNVQRAGFQHRAILKACWHRRRIIAIESSACRFATRRLVTIFVNSTQFCRLKQFSRTTRVAVTDPCTASSAAASLPRLTGWQRCSALAPQWSPILGFIRGALGAVVGIPVGSTCVGVAGRWRGYAFSLNYRVGSVTCSRDDAFLPIMAYVRRNNRIGTVLTA